MPEQDSHDNSEFFNPKEFKEKFQIMLKQFNHLISARADKDQTKQHLNHFLTDCFAKVTDEKTNLFMLVESFQTLILYANIYKSVETHVNIIKQIESPKWKEKLFMKYSGKMNMIYGEVLFDYFNLKNDSIIISSKSQIDELIKSKYYLLRAYLQSFDPQSGLSSKDVKYCLTLLSGCFTLLSRFFEPLYFLKLLHNDTSYDPNSDYITSLTLDGLKEKSCLNYNGQLLLKMHDCCTRAIESNKVMPEQLEQLKGMLNNVKEQITKAKFKIDKLKKHQTKVSETIRRTTPYIKFCDENQLFLNEHAYFCSCGRSIGDTLEIKTAHKHTEIDWVKSFEKLLEILTADFAVARFNYFQGVTEKQNVASYHKRVNPKTNSLRYLQDAYLKNTFRLCYSILDQISYGIFAAFDIDIDAYLKSANTSPGVYSDRKVYFLNMWDLYPFSDEIFSKNQYLLALYSIAQDLNKDKYAALDDFKGIRNDMEHKIFYINESKESTPLINSSEIRRQSLIDKSKLLLMLTKSAIICYAYLIRRQSRLLDSDIARAQRPE